MSAQLYVGDALAVLKTLPDGAARCCVTSPPYWGLRDYGTAKWEGGLPECDHKPPAEWIHSQINANSGLAGGFDNQGAAAAKRWYLNGACRTCGAVRVDIQLGLERTPEEYVARLVEVFRELRRVLTKDGTLWLNLGDSYSASPKGNLNGQDKSSLTSTTTQEHSPCGIDKARIVGLKPKDLVGIPWLVAFALRADGWWLRSDIIWSKPNPMPESVTDRPTRAHEYLFLFSRSARYYYDAAAIRTPLAESSVNRLAQDVEGQQGSLRANGGGKTKEGGANARSVWEIATQGYPEAHFATFPEELARRCILAGSAPGDVVLDPFGGSGTVAQVATGNGRGSIYIDLNPQYLELARQRIGPMLCVPA